MDYETADGSQLSVQEVFESQDGKPVFKAVSVTAFVDGKGFAGKTTQRMSVVDVDVVKCLRPVPAENINPPFPAHFTLAPPFDIAEHYLKGPAFSYEDSEPGRTFIADCLLNEATVLEKLRMHPHPNIVQYYGCVVKDGRIAQLCLKRYFCSLADYAQHRLTDAQREKFFLGVSSAVQHLHALGLAHNDISTQNVCIDADGNPAIVDFDSCLPFGQRLMKGSSADGISMLSDPANDKHGLEVLRNFLADLEYDEDDVTSGAVDGATENALLQHNLSPDY